MQIYMLSPANTVIPISLEKAAKIGDVNQQLARTNVRGFRISTIFLGIDHDHESMDYDPVTTPVDYKPLIFETMIFGGNNEHYQTRYRNYNFAMMWHKKLVTWMEQGKNAEELDYPPCNEEIDDNETS